MPPKEGAEHGRYQHGKNQHSQACSDGLSRAGTAPHTPTPSLGESLGYVTPGHSLSLCVSQREDEIEAIISISDGLNLVSAHLSQPSGSMQLPGPEHSSLLQSPGGGGGAPGKSTPACPQKRAAVGETSGKGREERD